MHVPNFSYLQIQSYTYVASIIKCLGIGNYNSGSFIVTTTNGSIHVTHFMSDFVGLHFINFKENF